MGKLKAVFFLLLSSVQYLQLFGQGILKEHMPLVKMCANYVYSQQHKKASTIIDSIDQILPNHPITPLLSAQNMAWQEMPMNIESKNFEPYKSLLEECIERAKVKLKSNPNDEEGIFFTIAARGLLAEYYADGKEYMAAIKSAQKVYHYIKKSGQIENRSPEFYVSSGLYNYTIEHYYQKHVMYRPFLWVFKRGNKRKGLEQLKTAAKLSALSKVEAHLYLSYIYLRYENAPDSAQFWLERVHDIYPENRYIKSKLMECYFKRQAFEKTLNSAKALQDIQDPYYKVAGLVFEALVLKERGHASSETKSVLESALLAAKELPETRGDYYLGLLYLNLGIIQLQEGQSEKAEQSLEKAIEISDDDQTTKQSKKYLKKI